MSRRLLLVGCFSVLGACSTSTPATSGSSPSTATTAPSGSAAATANKPGAPADPQAAMAQAMTQMAQLNQKPGAANFKAINWRELEPFFGAELADWKAVTPFKGDTASIGTMQITSGKRDYASGTFNAHVEVVDSSMNPSLSQAFRMMRLLKEDGSERYLRAVDVGGQPGVEEWTHGHEGKVSVLVGERYLVAASANLVPDTKSLVALVSKMDLGKMAALGK